MLIYEYIVVRAADMETFDGRVSIAANEGFRVSHFQVQRDHDKRQTHYYALMEREKP